MRGCHDSEGIGESMADKCMVRIVECNDRKMVAVDANTIEIYVPISRMERLCMSILGKNPCFVFTVIRGENAT